MNFNQLKFRLKEFFSKDKDVLFVYIYGSQSKGTGYLGSDLDLAVYLSPGNKEFYLRKDEQFLGELAQIDKKIDVRLLNVMPLLLKYEVISRGEVIFSRDEKARVNFETQILCRYFEMKPFFDEEHHLTMKKIKAGVFPDKTNERKNSS